MSPKSMKEKLFHDKINIRQRVFVLNVFVTLVILGVSLIEIILTDVVLWDVWLLMVLMLFILLVGIFSVKTQRIKLGACIFISAMCFAYFPITFLNGGGMNGDAPSWFIFIVLLISILLDGKAKIFYYVVHLLIGAACYYVSLTRPDWIIQNGHFMAHVYSFSALIMISIAVSVMITLEISLFQQEKKRKEEQRREVEALSRSQNQFFSSMSHEIRTPINTILGLNEMILREDVSDEVAEDAANIRAAGKMLLSLINDILDLQKFQSGKMQLTYAPYKTGEMLSELVGMLWVRAKEKNLEFRVNVSPEIPAELVGDEVRIKQILINVINNAIKYTKEGSVTLTVDCEKKEGNTCVVTYRVADTGIGIKKEDMPYLFSAFKRVDEDKNRHIEGTGLGLSIVKQLLDLMGGRVTVNSVYMQGSTFVVEIPQQAMEEKLLGKYDFNQGRDSRRIEHKQRFEAPEGRILVVDDNASNLLVTTKLLRETKIVIDTAKSGEEALKKTLNIEYDAIFMDHLMPEMDGIECKNLIKTQTGGKNRMTKIVILTANAGEENRELYAKEGFDGYLVKPVSGAELENELYHLLPKNKIVMKGDHDEILEETISWMQNHQKKKKVIVTTESVADLPPEIIRRYGIVILPHKVRTQEGTFKDGVEIDTRGVIAYMEDETKTVLPMAPDVREHEIFFAKQLAVADNVLHVSISSKVENSGCPVAKEAAKAFDNVFVFDSRHLSSGQGLLVIEACRLAEQGKEPEEIMESLRDLRKRIRTSFIVENLDFLARSKQVSTKIASIVKSLMGRPVLILQKGKMGVGKIYFGPQKRVWKKYIDYCLAETGRIDERMLFITYVGLTKKDMDWIRTQVDKKKHFDEIYFEQACASIAVNCGPGTFGLLLRYKGISDYKGD